MSSLRLTVCEILSFRCNCAMTLTFDLDDKGHILFLMEDGVTAVVKINFLRSKAGEIKICDRIVSALWP